MDCLNAFSTSISAFTATNLDDIVLLMLLFSQVDLRLQGWHIVFGQYLGFTVLILASLPGFFGHFILPTPWLGLLGILPIILGLRHLLDPDPANSIPVDSPVSSLVQPTPTRLLSPQVYGVAALTIANGSDNIGLYAPLFANCTGIKLSIMVILFFGLVGCWCYLAYQLIRLPAVAQSLMQYGHSCIPYLLIGIGVMILWDSQVFADRGLLVIAASLCIGYLFQFNRTSRSPDRSAPSPEIEQA